MRMRIAALLASFVASEAAGQAVVRVSVDSAGIEANGSSGRQGFHQRSIAFSEDGRFLAFVSDATNLVSGDTNGVTDVFVRELATGTVERVSVDSMGVEANAPCVAPVLSADGRYVAFWSEASNLVTGDTNGVADSFLHDRTTGVTERVSVTASGGQPNGGSYRIAISSDARLVAFESDATNLVSNDANASTDLFVLDRVAGTLERVSVTTSGGAANKGGCFDPSISADGTIVAFSARATNLVAGDTNGAYDVFVRDRSAGATLRVSVDSSGAQGSSTSWHPVISADGRFVAFESYASNLVAGDTNGQGDVFVHELATGVTERVSVASSGAEGDESSLEAAISSDGRFVTFAGAASNLTAWDSNGTTDVFLRDRAAGTTTLVSIDCAWDSGDGPSNAAALPGDGSLVAFASEATDLVAGDANAAWDVFLYDPSIPPPQAAWTNYGAGHPGTLGVPSLTASADPELGATISIDVGNSAGTWTAGLLAFGLASAYTPTSADGTLLVDPRFFAFIPVPHAGISFDVTIPRDPTLCGESVYLQGLELDFGASRNIAFTPGLELAFGH